MSRKITILENRGRADSCCFIIAVQIFHLYEFSSFNQQATLLNFVCLCVLCVNFSVILFNTCYNTTRSHVFIASVWSVGWHSQVINQPLITINIESIKTKTDSK